MNALLLTLLLSTSTDLPLWAQPAEGLSYLNTLTTTRCEETKRFANEAEEMHHKAHEVIMILLGEMVREQSFDRVDDIQIFIAADERAATMYGLWSALYRHCEIIYNGNTKF